MFEANSNGCVYVLMEFLQGIYFNCLRINLGKWNNIFKGSKPWRLSKNNFNVGQWDIVQMLFEFLASNPQPCKPNFTTLLPWLKLRILDRMSYRLGFWILDALVFICLLTMDLYSECLFCLVYERCSFVSSDQS